MNTFLPFHRWLLLLLAAALAGCAITPPMVQRKPGIEGEAERSNYEPERIFHPGRAKDPDGESGRKPVPYVMDPKAEERRGIATAFGDPIDSEAKYVQFKRGFLAKPYAVGVLYYNDAEGAASMANYLGRPIPLSGGPVTTAKGVLDWGVKSSDSEYLAGYLVDGKMILKGEEGDRYAVFLKNNTRQPLEFVVSVDGLDVIDGEPASYAKRGYVVGPKRTVEVKGFRTSTTRVAAFQFSRVRDSYAALRHGDARNVGVIGVAVFTRKGKNPWVLSKQRAHREEADPFPVELFAIPPS